MKNPKLKITACLIAITFIISLATPVLAKRGRGRGEDDNWRGGEHSRSEGEHRSRSYRDDRRSHERYRNDRNYVFDKRHNHNRYYPKRGYVVDKLPGNYRTFNHRREQYYFYDGIWYRPAKFGFSVVLPPIGLAIPMLPPFYTTVWVRGTPYYYSDGAYYMWRAEDRVYTVVDPPSEDEVVSESDLPDKLFIYPKGDQNEEQQATDRYQCHRWAANETGFDPTKPGGNVPDGQNNTKRLEYQRAMKACLEARNYSVQ